MITLRLPDWVEAHLADRRGEFATSEQKMRLAVELGEMNHRRGTGGPFGAVIFGEDGRLVSAGVNLVVPSSCCFAHAEMLAIGIAQQELGTYDLGGPDGPPRELVTSTEPCAMCLGAIAWGGLRRLVCGARDSDAREAGFDEGSKLADWITPLERRGVAVVRDVCRDDAREALRRYAEEGGTIYNPCRP